MSFLRRRLMTQMESDPIPRERIVFSNPGDVILTDVTKKYEGAAICGMAIIHQTYYPSPYGLYWLYLILMSKAGRVDHAVIASKWAANGYLRFTGSDGYVHSYSNTTWGNPQYNSIEEAITYAQSINVNNLPIMNLLTDKSYEGQLRSGGSFSCKEAVEDLLDYYYGVI